MARPAQVVWHLGDPAIAQVSVLFVGLEPTLIDFSGPDFANKPGLDAVKIQAGIDAVVARLQGLGFDAAFCPVDHGATAGAVLRARLAAQRVDCVVIGAGIGLFARQTPLPETLVNAGHAVAPRAKFAFNTNPADMAEAVQRWFPQARRALSAVSLIGGEPWAGASSLRAASGFVAVR